MTAIVEALIILMTYSNPVVSEFDICKADLAHLPVQKQIEISIGCSTVNGRTVYSYNKIQELYE